LITSGDQLYSFAIRKIKDKMIEVTGLDEVRANLAKLEIGLRTEYVLNAVKAGAAVFKDALVEAAPILDEKTAKSTSLEPGELKRDIKARTKLDEDGFAVAVIGPSRRTAYVARFLEFGHRLVKGGYSRVEAWGNRGGGHEVGQVPAHEFLRPAFEASEEEAIEAFKTKLRDEIAGGLK
jgi:HK97 gp10 family phage protein